MTYTAPNALTLAADWTGFGDYPAPTASAVHGSWYVMGQGSPLGNPSIVLFGDIVATWSAPSMLQAPSVFATPVVAARSSAPGPLGTPRVRAFHDWTKGLGDNVKITYECEIEGEPSFRVPISSWQATAQVERQNFAQAVIPAVSPYVQALTARTPDDDFVVYRIATFPDGERVEQEMVRAPLQQVRIEQGPLRQTATLSGYAAATFTGGGAIAPPVHYWPLDEASGTTITDSITGEPGAVLNDPTSTTANASGKFAGSRNLGATTSANGRSHLRLWSGAENLSVSLTEWTLSCWIKRESATPASFWTEFFNIGGWRFDQNTLWAYLIEDGSRVFVEMYNSGGDRTMLISSPTFPTLFGSGWHHVAIAGNASSVTVYLDGAVVASGGSGLPLRLRTSAACCGGSNLNSWSDSEVDDVAVFDYALTTDDAAFLWNDATGRSAVPEDADPEGPPPSEGESARALTGVRSLSQYGSLTRVRADIDWLLRPGMTALAGGRTLNVAYINYYVSGNQAYMDVGERAE